MWYPAEPMNTIYSEAQRIISTAREWGSFDVNLSSLLWDLNWSKHPAWIVEQIKREVAQRLEKTH